MKASTPNRFESQYPNEAAYLIKLYEGHPRHLIIEEINGIPRFHMCYFPDSRIFL